MIMLIIGIVIGFLIGGFFGITLMCIMQVTSVNSKIDNKINKNKEDKK